MTTRQIYQTLEDRDNPDQVERSGPFLCSDQNAWLGSGYYFWDSFLNNAHWWGQTFHPKGYIICQATYVDDKDKCLDLTTVDGIQEFTQAIELMRDAGINASKVIYVPRVIEYLKRIGHFKWEATKANPANTRNIGSEFSFPVRFKERHDAYVDLCPPIQICFYTKTALQLSGYRIIHPLEYVEGYAV